MNRKLTTTLLSAALVLFVGTTSNAWAADYQVERMASDSAIIPTEALQKSTATNDIYIVQLKGDPVLAYEGDIRGFKATKPGKGKKLNPNSAHVKKYAAHLKEQQDQVIHSAGGTMVYNYRYAFNAFAARMSASDAAALRNSADVVRVWKDEMRQLHTDGSPNYIGLTEGGEAWSKGYTGENVVIGAIDTGIWPENPSFADVATPKKGNKGPLTAYSTHPDFVASGCDFGNSAANPGDLDFSCNNKLVSATCYNSGFSTGPDPSNPCGGDGSATGGFEFQSARDYDGHGSHTASTAGGNNGVAAQINGEFAGTISGVAPRARIAAYKVCWDGPDPSVTTDDGCFPSDSAAAIDQAVYDGVDVINFSIGGSSNSFSGPDDIAFLFAADAGVYVATSNGNSGPGAGTVGTPSGVPWITAVGATHDDGVFYTAVTVHSPGSVAGDYNALEGAGPVLLADTGTISGNVTLVSDVLACGPVDPIVGIALASRGACAFSDKYNNAAAAGATGIIVFNDGANDTRINPIVMSAPGTSIPGVMISYFDGVDLASASGVSASMEAIPVSAESRIADFSSRGPNNGSLDIIKPDVSAPGVAILAAGAGTDTFMSINGTSMASPHVAGAFALLKQAHPDWSAAQARSALMTTARSDLMKTFGSDAADPFDIGAGEILPSDAFDPGLSYDAGFLDYLAHLCGEPAQAGMVGQGTCDALAGAGFSLDPSDLNLASIGVASLAGQQTVTRTVTSVANNNGWKTYNVSVDAPPGIDVSVSPSTIKLKKGMSATYEVTFTTLDSAAIEEWAFGSLTWSRSGGYNVRSPIAVKPVVFVTADEVDGDADGSGNGSVGVPVAFGFEGAYSASVSGIEASFFGSGNVNPDNPVDAWCVDLPAMPHFRAAMFDEETNNPGSDDLDMHLWYKPGGCAGGPFVYQTGSTGPTTEEAIDISDAAAGGYHIQVYYFAAPDGNSNYNIWYQPVIGDNANTTVDAPASATLGTDVVTVEYTGLVPTRNLGVLHHADENGEIARTILNIDAR